MRNMSFSLTEDAFLAGAKDVTRRLGWLWLKPGDRIQAVRRCMGLKRGEKVQPLGVIKVVDVRRERLDAITEEDVVREGFPELTSGEFVEMFRRHMRAQPDTVVTRIEFVVLEYAKREGAA